MYGILAQLVEHLTFNQVVGGSTPPCLICRLVAEKCYKRLGEALRGWGVFLAVWTTLRAADGSACGRHTLSGLG